MLIQQVNRYRSVQPVEALFSGRGRAANPSPTPPGYSSAVGSAQLPEGNYGKSTHILGNIYFHVRAAMGTNGQATLAAFLSKGPTCVNGPADAQEVTDWLVDRKFRSVNVKKTNDGSIGTATIVTPYQVLGNYVKLFEVPMEDDKYEQWARDPKAYYGPLMSEILESPLTIGQLRDCKIYLAPTKDETIRITWAGVYTADANKETLWILDNHGRLVAQIMIREDEENGFRDIPLKANEVYQVQIPGYSFRNYQLSFSDSLQWILEPTKLQFMGFLPENSRFYFKVKANEQAYFCMKDYNRGAVEGPYGAVLTRIQDGAVMDLKLEPQTYYYQHSKFALPKETIETSYRLDLKGQGRAAFWLDGTDNLFTDRLSWYARPVMENGQAVMELPASPVPFGKVPIVGHYMPYVEIPAPAKPTLAGLKAQTANIYTFADVIAEKPNWEDGFRQYMSSTMGLQRDWTILANTGRNPVIHHDTDPVIKDGVNKWIECMGRIADGKEHYISAADEPNLNYPSYEVFESHFASFAAAVRAHPKTSVAGVKIAAVASSRYDHGTTVDDSLARKGKKWAERLVEKYPQYVDAIVWHDWTVRGLLNLRQYSETVEEAWKLSNNGQRRLAIEQTNTSGGQSVSLYDQNTHFASLWWASVFINCTRTGKLDDLMWFPVADEVDHPKGLLFTDSETTFSYKPVAKFHMFLMSFLEGTTGGKVIDFPNYSIEIDSTWFKNTKGGVERDIIFGVNKSERTYDVNYANVPGAKADWKLQVFNNASVVTTPAFTLSGGVVNFSCPPGGIWALTRKV